MGIADRLRDRSGCALLAYGTATVILTLLAVLVLSSAFASIRACRWITGEGRRVQEVEEAEPPAEPPAERREDAGARGGRRDTEAGDQPPPDDSP